MPTVISFQSKYASLSSLVQFCRSENKDIPQCHLQRTRDEPTNPKPSTNQSSVAFVSKIGNWDGHLRLHVFSLWAYVRRYNTYSKHHSTSISKQFRVNWLVWNIRKIDENFLRSLLPRSSPFYAVSRWRQTTCTYPKQHSTSISKQFRLNLRFLNILKISNIPRVRVHNEVQAQARRHQVSDNQPIHTPFIT